MHSSSLLAASVLDALPHLVGMLMVMTVLAILWGICVLVALGVRALHPEDSAPMAPVAATAATTGAESTTPSPPVLLAQTPELVAVIAAAVASTVGRSHRVVSIKPAGSEWEKAGRQSVLSSHRIR